MDAQQAALMYKLADLPVRFPKHISSKKQQCDDRNININRFFQFNMPHPKNI